KRSPRSGGAALKYFLFGGMSAGFLLFGMSLLYGFSGSIALGQIAAALGRFPQDPILIVAMVMVVAGFAFKLAAAPFHMWAPEAYQGAPTWSAAFIASSSKLASFFALFLVVYLGLMGAAGSADWHGYSVGWAPLLAMLAAISMLWGNLAAIAQTSLRRLLAYSATGHAGYMLIALVTHNQQSLSALLYYVFTYALAAIGAFGLLSALEQEGVDNLADLSGLGLRAPDLAFCLLIFLLSLAGIPPLAGFFGKFYVFVSALHTANSFGLFWLVMLALVMSAISLFYYLRVLKYVYVREPAAPASAVAAPVLTRVTLWSIAGLLVLLGCAPGLLLGRIAAALSVAWR
ncbi:MAG TPA: NADH-quinone oxidoreductase subunit N, partial [Acidobacteriaceae bacterium]|nr:NADH-quinone oxidoreductase subunit N [Acidobacteriaceae bacterium]